MSFDEPTLTKEEVENLDLLDFLFLFLFLYGDKQHGRNEHTALWS